MKGKPDKRQAFIQAAELLLRTGAAGFEELCDLNHRKVSEDVLFSAQSLAAE